MNVIKKKNYKNDKKTGETIPVFLNEFDCSTKFNINILLQTKMDFLLPFKTGKLNTQ